MTTQEKFEGILNEQSQIHAYTTFENVVNELNYNDVQSIVKEALKLIYNLALIEAAEAARIDCCYDLKDIEVDKQSILSLTIKS